MLNGNCYAHSLQGAGRELWHPLDQHLRAVAEIAAGFAKPFGSSDWAFNAGLLHDLGKADDAFQAYLLRENGLDDSEYSSAYAGRINHSGPGAALAEECLGRNAGLPLSYLIAGHHAGLPDWYPADTKNAALQCRLAEGRENLERLRDVVPFIMPLLRTPRPPSFVNPNNFHLWVRMLFSCLVDADFLDTEGFMNPAQSRQRFLRCSLAPLKNVLDEYMSKLSACASPTAVNKIRHDILSACRAAAEQAPGIFSLTAPTGGGKTLASMVFALDHAVAHDKDRIIYVIPYTSIIEQTAATLKGIFGPERVIEHHSNVDPDDEIPAARLAAENWDAPIIVTTSVQFFESLYAASPSRCRKLHNIVNSVVILDEVQLLPPTLLAPCVDVLNNLAESFQTSLVLSTATQPALSTLPAPCPRLKRPFEIIPDAAAVFSKMQRTQILVPRDLNEPVTWDELAGQLAEHAQVLCIVNTRGDCYDLFNLMPPDTIHLSALMCAAHRSKTIAAIKERLNNGSEVRVISTQLVEAGVDLDFPVVFRALAGIDSIVQAAGRCNREGRMNKPGKVHVFVPPKGAPRGLLQKGESVAREMFTLPGLDLSAPDTFTRFYESFYARVNDTGARFHDWLVKDVNPDLKVEFRTAAANFCLIEDQAQRPVFVLYGDSPSLIEQLRLTGPTRALLRSLQRFTVNLPVWMCDRMLNAGQLQEVSPGYFAQNFPSMYHPVTGLKVYETNNPVEDLIS